MINYEECEHRDSDNVCKIYNVYCEFPELQDPGNRNIWDDTEIHPSVCGYYKPKEE
jgi:hypothetical protein